jgi:cell division protein ZapA
VKQIEVTILGQSYMLGCPDGGEALLRAAVSTVDQEMSAIRDAGKVKARERMAVLAALNLAYQLADNRAVAPLTAASALASNDEVQSLIHRIDQALGDDGHLL